MVGLRIRRAHPHGFGVVMFCHGYSIEGCRRRYKCLGMQKKPYSEKSEQGEIVVSLVETII